MKKIKKALLCAVFLLFTFALSVLFIVLPKSEYSENEKRVLSEKPTLSFSSVADGTFSEQLDTYLADHFPFRDTFVGINAYAKLFLGENGSSGVYKCSDGYLISEQVEIDLSKAKSNFEKMYDFSKKCGLETTYVIVPSSGYIMDSVLPKLHKAYRDEEVFAAAKSILPESDFIDLRSTFEENSDSVQIYYKTDHHLTSQGSLLMYNAVCDAKKIEKSQFTLDRTIDGFYGTAYSKSGLWLTKPDTVEILKSTGGQYEVTIPEKNGVYNSLYFEEHIDDADKYPIFLDGNHALVTVKNKNQSNGKRLLLIKDSFAHCFTTFLIENYEEICLVDLRYYRESVSKLIEDESLNELMFLYGVENAATSTDLGWMM